MNDLPAPVEMKMKFEEEKKLHQILYGIFQFEFNKSTLKPVEISFSSLSRVSLMN